MNRRMMIVTVALVVVVGLVVGGYFTFRRTLLADFREAAMNVEPSDTIAYGAVMFETRGCTGCHRLDSAGAVGNEGPNLSDIHLRHEAAYIEQSLREPNAVIADNCPEGNCESGVMPMYGSILNDVQIEALVTFLMAQPSA
ncbi:MAG: cytochrome c [Chloroflexota bacterium]|nr:cytochrome c [Chloroflexota bacterium]